MDDPIQRTEIDARSHRGTTQAMSQAANHRVRQDIGKAADSICGERQRHRSKSVQVFVPVVLVSWLAIVVVLGAI